MCGIIAEGEVNHLSLRRGRRGTGWDRKTMIWEAVGLDPHENIVKVGLT
jgi:hypothetical protein